MNESKSQPITKQMVWEAYKRVKSNQGGAGVDGVSLKAYESDLKSNLYKLWNRLASGSYFPPPVKEVKIPKSDGGERKLGIPTVSDRVAQMVVKMYLEPILEPIFDDSSYGYRPKRSAYDALLACQQNCYEYSWVIDLDIKGFFDHMDHELLIRALTRHTQEKWIHLYINRWLKAPVQTQQVLRERSMGTPQGGVISPLLSNLYLHYALDKWMRIYHSKVCFERYADDCVIHCRSRGSAEQLLAKITNRLQDCGLRIHPLKTRIVYCKRSGRKEDWSCISFDFLGYTFKPRRTVSRVGEVFLGFNPGVSQRAIQKMNTQIKSMGKYLGCLRDLKEVAEAINPLVRGWIHYYGRFRRQDLRRLWDQLNNRLLIWLRKKYKRVRRSRRKALVYLQGIYRKEPNLFVYWKYGAPLT